MTGDGAGVLYNSIQDSYRQWNGSAADTVAGSYKNTGGWPASRIRATLCGADELTDSIDIHPDTQTGYAGSGVLTETESLLSCFPKELQSAVVAKEVRSDTVYDDLTGNTQTTYDRLWLYSVQELYGGTGGDIRPNEGTLYQRQVHLGINYSNYAPMKSYNEAALSRDWWLRSASRNSGNRACSVSYSGNVNSYFVYRAYGLAPGFCVR